MLSRYFFFEVCGKKAAMEERERKVWERKSINHVHFELREILKHAKSTLRVLSLLIIIIFLYCHIIIIGIIIIGILKAVNIKDT